MALVDMEGLKPNSHKYKEEMREEIEKKELKSVVSKKDMVTTKKSRFKNFLKSFIKSDGDEIKEYIIYEMLIPGIISGLQSTIDFIFSSRSHHSDYTDYRKSYDRKRGRHERKEGSTYEEEIDYRDIIIRRREPATEIINALQERIDMFGYATVADLYHLTGYASNYVDNNWGWTDKRSIGIRRVSEGFLIKVDDARYIEK